ncbi:MAG: hypothetical protein ACQERZ_05185 [Fusobacteriota bacterium]
MSKVSYWDMKKNGMKPAIIAESELGEFIYYVVDLKRKIKLHKTKKPIEAIMTLEMMQHKYGDNNYLKNKIKKDIEDTMENFKTLEEVQDSFENKIEILKKLDKMKKSELVELIKKEDLDIKYSKFNKGKLISKIKKEILN